MEWITDSRILIVGLGLMGGSYAKALKRLGFHVTAIDTDPAAIDFALSHHLVDRGFTQAEQQVISESDAVIFALYPTVFRRWIGENQQYFHPGTMLTDVTGVKSCVVYDIQSMLRPGVEFVPAHPMAGRERSGVQASDDKIFRGANYIVTPTDKNTPEGIEWCKGLGRILGFEHIAVMSPEEHDQMIGFVSQLTHCIAVSLMTCTDNAHLAEYTGDSFRDLTRIARINDLMWSELFLMNKQELLRQMDIFLREFRTLRDLLEAEDRDALREKMRLSTRRRKQFDVEPR